MTNNIFDEERNGDNLPDENEDIEEFDLDDGESIFDDLDDDEIEVVDDEDIEEVDEADVADIFDDEDIQIVEDDVISENPDNAESNHVVEKFESTDQNKTGVEQIPNSLAEQNAIDSETQVENKDPNQVVDPDPISKDLSEASESQEETVEKTSEESIEKTPEETIDTTETTDLTLEETSEAPKEEQTEKTVTIKELTKNAQKKNRIEAAMFIAGRPVGIEEISIKLEMGKKEVDKLMKELAFEYMDRNTSIEIVQVGDKFSMQIKPEYTEHVKKFTTGGLIPEAVMRTLTIVALKQPINKSLVVKMRGSGAYQHIKFLVDRGFLEAYKKGRSSILTTTDQFSDTFGLSRDQKKLKKQLIDQLGIKGGVKSGDQEEKERKERKQQLKNKENKPENKTEATDPQ